MPQKLDEIHDAVVRRLKGKINPRTGKPYSESEMWAIARAQFEKLKNKSFHVNAPVSKFWEEDVKVEKSISSNGKSKKRFIEVTVSGLKEDREGEMMSQKAIDNMIMQYKSGNIPFFSDHGQVDGLPVYSWKGMMGVWVDAHQEDDKLKAVVRLNNAHPDAELFWKFVQEGMPISFSIGGTPLEEPTEIEIEEEIISSKKTDFVKAKIIDMEAERKRRNMSVDEFYAAPRDPPSASALPIFDAAHVRNAMARFNQTKFNSPAEKAKAKRKILAAANKFKIDASGFEGKNGKEKEEN